ncbi:MAG: right-handed parallel beta-helix repeat-containing protein [Candidatus Omnitrophota bacterium]|nr:MAG: right-handed parallel beta-helix repeat-containing protein [Candidatus Omnitrophota bacterium]
MIEGITFENQTIAHNALGYSAILAVGESVGMTIRNCTIRGPGKEAEYVRYSTTQANFGILVVGIGLVTPPSAIRIEGCTVENIHIGIETAKLALASPLGDPSVTVRNCIIQNCAGPGIQIDAGAYPESPDPTTKVSGPGNVIENNQVMNCVTGIALRGGYSVVRNNTISHSDVAGIVVSLSPIGVEPILPIIENCGVFHAGYCGFHATFPIGFEALSMNNPFDAVVRNCAFVGNDSGVQCFAGKTTFEHCIIAGNQFGGVYVFDEVTPVQVQMDHCDIYKNNLSDTSNDYNVDVEKPTNGQLLQLQISNSNIVGKTGIYNGSPTDPAVFDPQACLVRYCNVWTEGAAYVNVTPDHGISADPLFVSPQIDSLSFTKEGFRLQSGSPALTAGENGTYIGSQGPMTSNVARWEIYQ